MSESVGLMCIVGLLHKELLSQTKVVWSLGSRRAMPESLNHRLLLRSVFTLGRTSGIVCKGEVLPGERNQCKYEGGNSSAPRGATLLPLMGLYCCLFVVKMGVVYQRVMRGAFRR